MLIRALAAAVLACVLTACNSGMNAAVQTLQDALRGAGSAANPRLNPNFRYIRVTVKGRVAFLALGNEEKHPRGPIEVWFSAQREVLRLQNGRVVGAVGMTTEWRKVSLPELPSWSAVGRAGEPYRWVRSRDIMPGYRYGVRDELLLRVIPPPQKSALQNLNPQSLAWFEEQAQSGSAGRGARISADPGADAALPPARYAVDQQAGMDTVVYGEQCLASDLCFTWQRWPVTAQGPKDSR